MIVQILDCHGHFAHNLGIGCSCSLGCPGCSLDCNPGYSSKRNVGTKQKQINTSDEAKCLSQIHGCVQTHLVISLFVIGAIAVAIVASSRLMAVAVSISPVSVIPSPAVLIVAITVIT